MKFSVNEEIDFKPEDQDEYMPGVVKAIKRISNNSVKILIRCGSLLYLLVYTDTTKDD